MAGEKLLEQRCALLISQQVSSWWAQAMVTVGQFIDIEHASSWRAARCELHLSVPLGLHREAPIGAQAPQPLGSSEMLGCIPVGITSKVAST